MMNFKSHRSKSPSEVAVDYEDKLYFSKARKGNFESLHPEEIIMSLK